MIGELAQPLRGFVRYLWIMPSEQASLCGAEIRSQFGDCVAVVDGDCVSFRFRCCVAILVGFGFRSVLWNRAMDLPVVRVPLDMMIVQ
jgi:hypothetical protein